MKYFLCILLCFQAVNVFSISMSEQRKPFFHVPNTVSSEANKFLSQVTPLAIKAKTPEEWQKLRSSLVSKRFARENHEVYQKFVKASKVLKISGVSVLEIMPKSYKKNDPEKVLLYIHGGAYTLGDNMDLVTTIYAPIAFDLGVKAYAIKYRLAPEYPYPAALNDCVSVYGALVEKYGAKNIFIVGDSSGGALVLATVLKAHLSGLERPRKIALISPWSDITKTGDSYYTLEGRSPLLNYDSTLADSVAAYVGKNNPKDPLISPVYAEYAKDFPSTLIQFGTRDLFLSNCVRLSRKLRKCGVEVTLSGYEGMWHDFQEFKTIPESKIALKEIADYFQK